MAQTPAAVRHGPTGERRAGFEPGAAALWLLAALALGYLVAPVVALLLAEPWPSVAAALSDPLAQDAARASAVSATLSTLAVAAFGVPLAYALARWRVPARAVEI